MRAIIQHERSARRFLIFVASQGEDGTRGLRPDMLWEDVGDGCELPLALAVSEEEMAAIVLRELDLRRRRS